MRTDTGLDFFFLFFFFTFGVFTGLALAYILKNSFKPESGSRSNVPKIGILITDGKSQDVVDIPAQRLREAGVELFAIGKRIISLCSIIKCRT